MMVFMAVVDIVVNKVDTTTVQRPAMPAVASV